MKRPDHQKTPLSLALAGLFFGGFNGAQADSFNEWGAWAGPGPDAPTGPSGDGDADGEARDQSVPLADDIFDGFLASIPADEAPDAENPFAFADPPDGVWDVYASNGYGGEGGCCGDGAAATGTLALTPSTKGNIEGTVYGDGVVNLMLTDMDSATTDSVQAGTGFPGTNAFVGDDNANENFSPFFTEGAEGFINSNDDPGDVADMTDFFVDGRVATGGGLIQAEGQMSDGYYVAGQRTPSAYLVSQHEQALVGDVQGNYQGATFHTEHSVSIDVDFGGGTWGGNFTNGQVNENGGQPAAAPHNFTAGGGFNGQGQGVSDTIGGDANAGTVIFSFFGPAAEVLGGNVNVSSPATVVKDTFSALRGGPVIPGGFNPAPD